jgi:two-component system, NtrC family, sensor kinase
MKRILISLYFFLCYHTLCAQLSDKQLKDYNSQKSTDDKISVLYKYFPGSTQSAKTNILNLNEVLNHFNTFKNKRDAAIVNYVIGHKYFTLLQDYSTALKHEIASLEDFKSVKDSAGILYSTFVVAAIFQYSKNYEQSLVYFKEVMPIAKKIDFNAYYPDILNGIADCYVNLKKPDSSFSYLWNAISIKTDTLNLMYYIGTLGEAHLAKKDYDSAKSLMFQSYNYAQQFKDTLLLANTLNDLSQLFFEIGLYDSSINYARQTTHYPVNQSTLSDAYKWIYKSYEKRNNNDSALRYFKLSVSIKDSVFSTEKNNIIQSLNFQKQLSDKEKEQELIEAKKDFNHKLILYIGFGILFIISIIVILLYRSNQQQKKSKTKIEKAYTELKLTQAQLIQSEKMASLGELTAGIAHEIQNPLNFVNNFSEVNTELIDELKEERNKEIRDFKNEDDILNDIKENEEKINHHGKRADAIVKGMLQHSRSSTGVKEPTNINALADEYLRLSYHGLRAKDKDFNAEMKTDFDHSVASINLIPQDIGRVLLNLYNNAFYAVHEKQKARQAEPVEVGYEPTVSVGTKKSGNSVLITVSDNGNGIPKKIVDKIFQPFFTTKPTGQGTGLGLSLSYDIVKAHGGEIKVETKEGEGLPAGDAGTEFIIQLPA